MRYWDASAVIPLVVAEEGSARIRGIFTDDPVVVTWAWTRVEIVSAIERRSRAGGLTREERRQCLDRFDVLAGHWDEVIDLPAVRVRAIELLARHPLRAADAAQLAAARLVSEGEPASLEFVCLDERLSLAAEREGFRTIG